MSDDTDPGRLHTSVLVGPEGELRRHRKARAQAAARIHARKRTRNRSPEFGRRQQQYRSPPPEPECHHLVPGGRGGERCARRAGSGSRAAGHQRDAVGHYPFLAEGGLGSAGTFIGQDLYSGGSFVYDPWELYRQGVITAPNIILAGIVGSGKSSQLAARSTRVHSRSGAASTSRRPQRRAHCGRPRRRGPCDRPRPFASDTFESAR